jgi:hypothetical protein
VAAPSNPNDEVATDVTAPLVPNRRPESDEARVVAPVTFRFPFEVKFDEEAFPNVV